MKRLLMMGAMALLALTVLACAGASADGTDGGTKSPPTGIAVGEPAPGSPPVDPDGHMETKTVYAPILEAAVVTRGTAPRYALDLLVEVGDGCNRFERVDVARDGDVIRVSALRTVPAHPELMLCIMLYQTHDETVGLGSDFEAGREYTVIVNDGERTLSFVAG